MARGSWIVQAWVGQRKIQEEAPDDLTLKHAQSIAREWSRGFGGVVRVMPNIGNRRDYVEVWEDGKRVRKGTFARTTLVRNPPTRKAQAFIGRKIRRLAHEGMQAPRRVAAAYSLARRAGFKVPKRARKNPKGVSEREAWNKVRAHAERILERKVSRTIEDHAEAVRQWATMMLSQLDEGVHENPTLAVLGNPPAKVVGTLSHRLYELRYKHAEDGKDYRHPFGPGAKVLLLADKSVWIKARHSLWEDHQ